MDSFRDRFNGRDRMGSDRGGRDRYDRQERDYDRSDREYDRPERDDMGDRAMRRGSQSYGEGGAGLDEIANVIEKSNSKQLEVFADCIDDVKDEVYASEKEIMKALDQIASGSSARSMRGQEATVARMDPAAKEEILRAVAGNTELLQALQASLQKTEEKEAEKSKEEAEAKSDAAEETKQDDPVLAALAQYYNNREEHVHKENVKCYRNVQAALSEQGTQIVEQNKKSLGFLKAFAIAAVALTTINIVLFLLFVYGFIY